MKDYLEAGKIVALHGIRGEMRLQPWSDDSAFLTQFHTVYFDAEGKRPCRLLSARAHGNVCLVKLEGIETPEQAEKLRGTILYIKKSDASLAEGSYFVSDIIGLEAVDEDTGEHLGTVKDVEHYPANDVWHIQTPGGTVLIPKVPAIVKRVDLQQKRVYIFKMKGLFDNED